MKNIIKSLTVLLLTLSLINCNSSKNEQNALYGIIYKDIHEVIQLKGYEDVGGAVLDNTKTKSGDYEFGFAHLNDSSKNRNIVTLEKFVKGTNPSQPSYQIIDTVNIDNLKPMEYITYCQCRQDTTYVPEIIALVIAEDDKEFYDKIVKAWKADTKTGKIVKIENTKGITCANTGYYAQDCGQPNETNNSDTTTVNPKQ